MNTPSDAKTLTKKSHSLVDMFDELEAMNPTHSRESYIRAPFGWPGGKHRSLQHILPVLQKVNHRKTWADHCGGSGIVSWNVGGSFQLKVFNDKHSGVTAFYRCLRDPESVKKLIDRLEVVCHSREEFVWASETWESCQDDVERAARWFYTVRMSFGQLGRNFGRSTQGPPQQANAYFNNLPEFWEIHKIIKKFQVENLDVIRSIRDYDSPDTVHYIDPDYIGVNLCYQHGVNHPAMLQTIRESRGFFAVSGYANELYDSQTFWDHRLTWEVHVSLTALGAPEDGYLGDKKFVMDRSQRAEEVLWIRESR